MRLLSTITKRGLIPLFAIAAFGVASSSAVASTGIRLASGTSLTVTARGVVTGVISGVNIICTIDGLGVIESSIVKRVGTRVAALFQSGASISNCNGGYSGTKDVGLNVTYGSFSGTLPNNITGASGIANGVAFTMTGGTVFGANRCQFRGNMSVTISGTGTSFSSGRFSGSVTSTGTGCPASGRLTSGTLSLYANASLGTTLTSVAIALF